jgi:hypothetical protein
MAKNPVNLNKLKEEIDNRKREKNMVSSQLGESVGNNAMPRDTFLNELIKSLDTGKLTRAASNVKSLNRRADIIEEGLTTGVVTTDMINKLKTLKESPNANVATQQTLHNAIPLNNQSTSHDGEMSPERDDQVFAEIDRRRKQTLTEALENTITNSQPNKPQQTQQRPQMNLNEGYLVENVKKIVDNYLIENFGLVVEEAIKSTILELYAVERIKEVIQENKEIIKGVVKETIREIQQANAKKKAQSS